MEIKTGVNKFYIGDTEENPLAQIILTDIDQNIIEIEHTYVYKQLKGKGAAKQLVKRVVEFAMNNNKKIVPICDFAKKEFEKNKEYECVLCNNIHKR